MSKRILYPVLAIGNEGIGAMHAHAARRTVAASTKSNTISSSLMLKTLWHRHPIRHDIPRDSRFYGFYRSPSRQISLGTPNIPVPSPPKL